MNNILTRVIAATALFLTSSTALPQFEGNALCTDKEGVFFFVNGVNTEFTGAIENTLATSEAMLRVMPDAMYDATDFQAAYNATNGLVKDLIESAAQDVSSDFSTFFLSIFGFNNTPEEFQADVLTLAGRITSQPSLFLTDSLSDHVQIYKANIFEGKKIMLIAHSQGTFYANQAYTLLSSQEQASVGIIAAAAMDDFVAGGYPHVTLRDDLAVLLVSAIKAGANFAINALIDQIVPWGYIVEPELRGPLPSNYENANVCEDFMGHSYSLCYLAVNSDSKVAIQSLALYYYRRLVPPVSTGNDGIITVTLTWGSNPDVDLHVFEPNGTQVFYNNLHGPSGSLDKDDIDGEGPEHYNVGCDTLEEGTYRVGVNYYYGFTPENAALTINAGLKTLQLDKYLDFPEGSAGNASPDPVANIVVTGDSTNGFEFDIVPFQGGGGALGRYSLVP